MMPRFFKDMPRPKAGRFEAVVIRVYCFAGPREKRCFKVNGQLRAYIAARLLALLEDLITPYWDGEVGINWAIRELKD